jgi:hypothetical protein
VTVRGVILAVCLACLAQAANDMASVARNPYLLVEYINSHPQLEPAALWNVLGVNDSALFFPPYGEVSGNASGSWRFLAARLFGKPFFVVVGLGMGGNGIFAKVEAWFDLSLRRAEPVFVFTKQGDLARDFEPCFIHFGKATATAIYMRQNTGERELAPSLSTASTRVLDTLRRIASAPRSVEAQWLDRFLEDCKDMPKKNALLRLLH